MTALSPSKSHFREFFRYTTLNIAGMMGLSCYILADTFFVSRALGATGLTALNLAIPAYNFIHGCGLMLGMGSATLYSIFSAATGSSRRGDAAFTTAFRMLCLFAAFFMCLGLFCSAPLARLLGADAVTFDMSRTYLQVMLLFSPLFLINDLLLCFIRNDGAPGLAMKATLTGNLANIILDYVFLFPMQLGIFGAVLATGFGPIISMMVLSPYFLRKRNGFHLQRSSRPDAALCRSILATGLPSLVAEISSGAVIIAFNRIILSLSGNIGVAAYGVVANLSLVVMAIYTGIAQGVQPLLSRSYGLADLPSVSLFFRYAVTTAAVLSAVIYGWLYFGADFVASVFNSQRDPQLQSMAITGLRLYFTACPFAGINIITSILLTSTEHTRPANVLSMLRGLVLILPAAFLMAFLWKMNGLWLAFPATELIVFLLGLIILRNASASAER